MLNNPPACLVAVPTLSKTNCGPRSLIGPLMVDDDDDDDDDGDDDDDDALRVRYTVFVRM